MNMQHEPARPLLDVAGLTAGYRRMQVLWGIDLLLHAHETVVLLGANGAGKTTLLKAILNLVEVWAGRVRFAGEDITRLRTDQRVRRGIVFMSDASGFPGLTIEENVRIGAQFLTKRRARERIDQLYATFPTLAERRRAHAAPAEDIRALHRARRDHDRDARAEHALAATSAYVDGSVGGVDDSEIGREPV